MDDRLADGLSMGAFNLHEPRVLLQMVEHEPTGIVGDARDSRGHPKIWSQRPAAAGARHLADPGDRSPNYRLSSAGSNHVAAQASRHSLRPAVDTVRAAPR